MSSCFSHLSPEGDFQVFEVQLCSIRRSASTGHLRHDSWSEYRDGYVSEDLESGRRRRKGAPKKPTNSDRHASSQKQLTVSMMPTEFASPDSRNYRRQYSSRESRKEIRCNLFDIVEDEVTTSNHEAYYVRDGSSQKVNKTAEDDIQCSVDSNGTEYYSCMDTELCENNNGVNQAHQRTNDSCRKVALKWILVIANFFFEVLSAIFDQLSSPHTSFYALIALLASFATTVICMIEIVYKGRHEKVSWRIRGKIYWFYHPSPSQKPFGTFKDIFVFVCAFSQPVISNAIFFSNIYELGVFSF